MRSESKTSPGTGIKEAFCDLCGKRIALRWRDPSGKYEFESNACLERFLRGESINNPVDPEDESEETMSEKNLPAEPGKTKKKADKTVTATVKASGKPEKASGKPEKAEKPEKAAKAAPTTKGGGAVRTRTPVFPLDAKISGVAKEHPFRGVRQLEFEKLRNGMTVSDYLDALRADEAIPGASLGLLKIAVEKGLATVK